MQDIRRTIIDNVAEDVPLTDIYTGLGGAIDKIGENVLAGAYDEAVVFIDSLLKTLA